MTTERFIHIESSYSVLEKRPPGGKKVLFFSVEPQAKLVGTSSSRISDSEGDISLQRTARAHDMQPKVFQTVSIYEEDAPIPNLKQFAAIVAGGASASVNDGHAWQERFEEVLRGIDPSGIPALLTCYSMQALVKAHEGTVGENAIGKRKFGVGAYELTDAGMKHWLFEGVPRTFVAFRSHKEEAKRHTLPAGMQVLAVGSDSSVAAVGFGSQVAGILFNNDLDATIMAGLSLSRIGEIRNEGMTRSQFLKSLQDAEPDVLKVRRQINRNFLRRMHIHHQRVS